jgi:hypothetical protein
MCCGLRDFAAVRRGEHDRGPMVAGAGPVRRPCLVGGGGAAWPIDTGVHRLMLGDKYACGVHIALFDRPSPSGRNQWQRSACSAVSAYACLRSSGCGRAEPFGR